MARPEPGIKADYEALAKTLSYAPCYEIDALGPVPFGSTDGERFFVTIRAIVTDSREAAEAVAWNWLEACCEAYEYPFDSDEWDIVSVRALNMN